MIKFDHATFQYPGGTPAVEDFTCEFGVPGGRLALLGANGAGKSTLLLALAALLLPISGSVEIDTLTVGRKTLSAVRRKVGMVFQNPDDQLFSPTVEEDVAFGPANMRLAESEIRSRVDDALNRMRIASLRTRFPQQLSAGEKRRAAIAGILAMAPEIILFDEPTSGLDPRGQRELTDIIRALPQFCVIATHDLAFAGKLCSDALVLQNGKLRRMGPMQELLADHAFLLECGLA